MKKYTVLPLSLTDKAVFTEASREELRVLLTLIERGGELSSVEDIALVAKVSSARANSALVLWEEEGVIKSGDAPTVAEEFSEKIELGKITERSANTVSREIRDNNLADLLTECATLMQKPALSTEETKIITALYTQFALGEEYIITLAAYLSDKGKLTSQRLGAEAERLIKRGVDCVEELETGAEGELRRIIGIHGRNLAKREKELAKKWFYEFGYSEEIISHAYEIMIAHMPTKPSLPYMDKVLTHWHEVGCKTLDECIRLNEREHAQMDAERQAPKPPSIPRKKPTPRYGDFDVNDAFEKALLRSYGEDSNK